MKKLAFACAVPCRRPAALATAALALIGCGAHAQGSVQILGVLSTGPARISNVAGGELNKLQNNLNWSNSIIIRGTEDLGDGMRAGFSLAGNLNLKTGQLGQGAATFNKNSWVSLGSRTFGDIQVGRNDVFAPEQCVVSAMCIGGLIFNLHPGNLDRIGGSQLANTIKYVSPDWGPFRARAYYSHGETDGGTNTGRAVGVVGMYRRDGLFVTASYENIKGVAFTPLNANTGIGLQRFYGNPVTAGSSFLLNRQEITLLGARVPVGKFNLYAQASNVKLEFRGNDDSLRTYELGAVYNVSDALSLTAAGYRSRFTSSRWDNYGMLVNYALSRRTSIFAGYAYEKVSGPNQVAQMFQAGGASSNQRQSAIAAGMRHTF